MNILEKCLRNWYKKAHSDELQKKLETSLDINETLVVEMAKSLSDELKLNGYEITALQALRSGDTEAVNESKAATTEQSTPLCHECGQQLICPTCTMREQEKYYR